MRFAPNISMRGWALVATCCIHITKDENPGTSVFDCCHECRQRVVRAQDALRERQHAVQCSRLLLLIMEVSTGNRAGPITIWMVSIRAFSCYRVRMQSPAA